MLNLKKYVPLSIAFLIGVVLTQTISFIYAQEAGEIIHGCVRPAGLLRIIDENGTCNPNETALNWNSQGPAGPQGPIGPTGATGTGGGGSLIGVFGGYTTDQMVGTDLGMDSANDSFRYRYLVGGNFSGTDFVSIVQSSNFSQTNLTNTGWGNAYTLSSDFTQADFSNARGCMNEKGSNFTSANFTNLNFNNATNDPFCKFSDSNFTDANFTNANLTNIPFINTTMTGAIWSNTTCPDGTNSDNNGNTCEGHLTP